MNTPESLRTLIAGFIKKERASLWTAMPAVVTEYDRLTARCSAMVSVLADNGEPYPLIHNIPVVMQGGNGFGLSFVLQVGDPILLVFCQRGISNVSEAYKDMNLTPQASSGGVLQINDPVAVPVIRSNEYMVQDGIGIHNRTGTVRVVVRETEVEVKTSGGGFVMDEQGTITFDSGAKITYLGDFVSASGVSLSNHTHTSGAEGSPTSPPIP